MMRTILSILAAAAAGLSAQAAAEDAEPPFVAPSSLEELDARIAEAFAASKIVGMQVALVGENGASWARGYGFLDKEKTRPVENDSVFRAGSISKSFTGVLAQMLVEDGLLDLSQPLAEAAPDVEFENRWEETDPVLLVDLAEHTTGWDDIQLSEYRDFGPGTSLAEGIEANPVSRTSRWKPGRYVSYNNVGPAILAYVMESRTGKSYETLIDERIIGPLGMENASFLPTEGVMAKVSGSFSVKGHVEPYTHIGVRPAGSLNTSATELAKFAAFLMRRGEWNGARLLTEESIDRIETPTRSIAARAGLKMGYGLGIFQTQTDDGVHFGHTGGIDGFVAEMGYYKDSRTGFVIMINAPDGEAAVKIRKLVAGFLRRDAAPAPAKAAPDVDLARYEGVYRQITPRTEFIRFATDILDIARVAAKDGELVVSPPFGGGGVTLVPLGDGLFVADGRTQADRIFAASPEGEMEMIRSLQNAYRRVSPIEGYWRLGLVAFTGLGLVVALLSSALWIVLRPFGIFRNSNRWRVWTLPTLAYVALGAVVAAFALASSGGGYDSIVRLGGPTPYSLTIAYGTIAFAVLAALSVLAAFFAPGASAGGRIGAVISSLSLAALAAYLYAYGWIGMTVWSYRPMVMG